MHSGALQCRGGGQTYIRVLGLYLRLVHVTSGTLADHNVQTMQLVSASCKGAPPKLPAPPVQRRAGGHAVAGLRAMGAAAAAEIGQHHLGSAVGIHAAYQLKGGGGGGEVGVVSKV